MKTNVTVYKIQEAAIKLFAENGYEKATMTEIAKAVGIKKPSIYAHYENKQEIFLSIIEELSSVYVAKFKEEIDKYRNLSVEEQLYSVLESTRLFFQHEDLGLFLKRMLLFPPHELEGHLLKRYEEFENQLLQIIRELFEKGIAAGEIHHRDVDELIDAYIHILDSCFIQLFDPDDGLVKKRLKAAWSFFWRSISFERRNEL
jgi:TetR/AcrR family transcriptional regulator, biofilm operon repressor